MCDNNVFTQIEKYCNIIIYDFKNILYRGREIEINYFQRRVIRVMG